MTSPTRRELEKRVTALREDVERDGFLHVHIGGNPESGGYYEWDDDRGEYVNEHGHTRADAPESDFVYKIEYE